MRMCRSLAARIGNPAAARYTSTRRPCRTPTHRAAGRGVIQMKATVGPRCPRQRVNLGSRSLRRKIIPVEGAHQLRPSTRRPIDSHESRNRPSALLKASVRRRPLLRSTTIVRAVHSRGPGPRHRRSVLPIAAARTTRTVVRIAPGTGSAPPRAVSPAAESAVTTTSAVDARLSRSNRSCERRRRRTGSGTSPS
jgi:hypothetical protein